MCANVGKVVISSGRSFDNTKRCGFIKSIILHLVTSYSWTDGDMHMFYYRPFETIFTGQTGEIYRKQKCIKLLLSPWQKRKLVPS